MEFILWLGATWSPIQKVESVGDILMSFSGGSHLRTTTANIKKERKRSIS